MSAPNESAVSLRWLLDDLGEPLAAAWQDVRDRMRIPNEQTIISAMDWISDPWIAKGVEVAGFLSTAAPIWDPPDQVDAWPDFGVGATLTAASLATRRTRDDTVSALISTATTDIHDGPGAAIEVFMASQRLIAKHGDEHMIFGDQVRAWILACVGSLLRGLAFNPADTDPETIAEATLARVGMPLGMRTPETWLITNEFGGRHLELLLNLTVQGNGEIAPLDPADLRIGQGIPWQQAWGWLSQDVPAEFARSAVQLAARLLRNPGLRLGLRRSITAANPELRTLATGVLRRWALTLKAMVWAEHALSLPWEVVRAADVACFAFSATKPEWPRRLLAISHRSGDVKPKLRHMAIWKSCRCAIDATYVPAWESNTGMIWGLFAAAAGIARVRTRGYETSLWCRREAEMVQHLIDRGDYLSNRVAFDIEYDQLSAFDEWETKVRGKPHVGLDAIATEFPPFGLEVWSPRPSPPLELTVFRAAGALRAMSAYIGDSSLVNRVVDDLRRHGDFKVIPAPTNQPDGWRRYAAIFEAVAALVGPLSADAVPLRLPDNYTEQDIALDRALTELIPDLSSGTAHVEDVLVAIEFLRTTWPVMVDQRRGRFLVINLQGVTQQQWIEDPRWSLHRGLTVLRSRPVPLWFLQLADQGLSTWDLPGDPPILTEHVEAQFGWMIETHPDVAEWRARYPEDSGLNMSAELLRLHKNG
jgi:hypothetical protein